MKPFTRCHLRALRPKTVSRRSGVRVEIDTIRELRGTPFALCNDEIQFVYGLLAGPQWPGLRKHNLWVFRTHQQMFAADFVVVDVSGHRRALGELRLPDWDVFVLDLKMGQNLGRGGGVQFRRAQPAAHTALQLCAETLVKPEHRARRATWLSMLRPRHVWSLIGSTAEVLDFFDDLPARRQARLTNPRRGRH